MLDEYVSYNDKKMPDPSMVLKPKKEKIYKPPPLPTKNLEINNQKKSINLQINLNLKLKIFYIYYLELMI